MICRRAHIPAKGGLILLDDLETLRYASAQRFPVAGGSHGGSPRAQIRDRALARIRRSGDMRTLRELDADTEIINDPLDDDGLSNQNDSSDE